MEVGKKLVKLRMQLGLTQEQLSEMLNMSRSTYAQYEVNRRTPDAETITMLANFFKVTTDYLLGQTDNPRSINQKDHSTEPTPQELEELLRSSNVQFDGAPLDETDKEEVLEFLRYAWNKLRAKK